MRTIVIYESMSGHAHAIADQIAEGLATAGSAVVAMPGTPAARDLASFDLMVVGGANPEIGLGEAVSGHGLRLWIETLPNIGIAAASFDTRTNQPSTKNGSAAKDIAIDLRHRGFRTFANPESFILDDFGGPLRAGEPTRAKEWGKELADRLSLADHINCSVLPPVQQR